MQITLPYGLAAHWTLDTTTRKISRLSPSACFEPLPDPAVSIRKALEAPRDYPPLASATVPGDQVVVTIPAGMPALEPLAWGVLQALMDAGVEPAHLVKMAWLDTAMPGWMKGMVGEGATTMRFKLADGGKSAAP